MSVSCLGVFWGGFGFLWKIFLRVTPVLRPEVLLHPPYPFVTSRVVSTALLTCYVSTCCNIDTLVFVSLWVSKIRFLGCIFGRAVLCIYYANEFSILPLFLSFFDSSYFFFISFLLPLFRLFWFVCFDSFLPLIRAICPIMFRAYCQPGRGGVTFDSLVNVPRCHVDCALCAVRRCFAVAVFAVVGVSIDDTGSLLLTFLS